MSAISAVFTNILGKTPLSASFGKVELLSSDNEPLVSGSSSEKCELRIEGMTCGSCVEVSVHNIIYYSAVY
jgi:Cu+-exporting ATPase